MKEDQCTRERGTGEEGASLPTESRKHVTRERGTTRRTGVNERDRVYLCMYIFVLLTHPVMLTRDERKLRPMSVAGSVLSCGDRPDDSSRRRLTYACVRTHAPRVRVHPAVRGLPQSSRVHRHRYTHRRQRSTARSRRRHEESTMADRRCALRSRS